MKQIKLFGTQVLIFLIAALIIFIAIVVVAIKLIIYFLPLIIVLIVLYIIYNYFFRKKLVKTNNPKQPRNYNTGKVIDAEFKEKD